MTKLKNWNCEKKRRKRSSHCDKTQELKLWRNSNCYKTEKTQIVRKLNLWQNSIYDKTLKESFSKNYLTPWQPMRCSLGSFPRCLAIFCASNCWQVLMEIGEGALFAYISGEWGPINSFSKVLKVWTFEKVVKKLFWEGGQTQMKVAFHYDDLPKGPPSRDFCKLSDGGGGGGVCRVTTRTEPNRLGQSQTD